MCSRRISHKVPRSRYKFQPEQPAPLLLNRYLLHGTHVPSASTFRASPSLMPFTGSSRIELPLEDPGAEAIEGHRRTDGG